MKLSPPTVVTWWIAVVVAALGVLLYLDYVKIPALSPYIFWLAAGPAGLLALLIAQDEKPNTASEKSQLL